ncbi:MAG: SRPBCC domain-containing protein [Ignavibacteria bacterium]|nr:SRPBCC domain-containing protein [Ignavibacteria bacterium]MBT8383952.1 SRPBCC domain-containing protein [Ignavibacteria bacterium]MBT8391320.1 SRPBCC domain-containing protein [Ignavibacteria bacterium]NNL20557.1 ATPase [Ignavibacteriaceae bacterium]
MNENKIRVNLQMGILKPIYDVFEAIVDPEKMSKYFISKSSGRMESGKTLKWEWEDFDAELEIEVQKIEKDKLVSFKWDGSGVECNVSISLEKLDTSHTAVKITEEEWNADYDGAKKCMGQVEGWTHFLCCLKAFLEYDINLRVGGVIK